MDSLYIGYGFAMDLPSITVDLLRIGYGFNVDLLGGCYACMYVSSVFHNKVPKFNVITENC